MGLTTNNQINLVNLPTKTKNTNKTVDLHNKQVASNKFSLQSQLKAK